MDRRKFIGRLFAAPLLAYPASLAARAGQFPSSAPPGQNQFPSSPQSQQGPVQPGQVTPPWLQLPPMPTVDPKVVLKEDQKEIVRDAKRLLDLASKLEHQVEKTDSSRILSLNMIHTTTEIEKLAKHIRSLASG